VKEDFRRDSGTSSPGSGAKPHRTWPDRWWAVEGILYMVIGGAVLGLVAEKLVPEPA
jgi:hypothetical protein